jgi:hypothetical protein
VAGLHEGERGKLSFGWLAKIVLILIGIPLALVALVLSSIGILDSHHISRAWVWGVVAVVWAGLYAARWRSGERRALIFLGGGLIVLAAVL